MAITLAAPIAECFRITPVQKAALKKLGIGTVYDLLHHLPVRYGDTAQARTIDSLIHGQEAVIFGKISGLKTGKGFRSKITMATGVVEDETGKISCVWFNQPYVAKMFKDEMLVRLEGQISQRRKDGSLYMSNPKIESVGELPMGIGDSLFTDNVEKHNLYPVYPESRGITSTWIYHALQKIFKSGMLDDIAEIIPTEILEKYHLPGIRTALIWIHTPLNRDDALSARKRFSFEEIFLIQLAKQKSRIEYENHPSYLIESNEKEVDEFIKRFPFQATGAQKRAISSILGDMRSGKAMCRLLEGDVGSGKTAVAATTAYAVISSDRTRQVAYMCPTEILARQHFESFIKYFSYLGVQIALITGSGCKKFPSKVNPSGWTDISRSQLLKWVANGEISVVVGTHALIQKSVIFKKLTYVIIDEQHRFGTAQRAGLVQKAPSNDIDRANNEHANAVPHLLSMTATPIPRTLALTIYGDLDITLLDESPVDRKKIITELVPPSRRTEVYEKIRSEIKSGRQAYVICPRIGLPDPEKEMALQAKSVQEETERLKKEVFPEFEIGMLHGKMSSKEKDLAMDRFRDNITQILCATSVVEVGVNVPNATIMVIEGAERFGLSQLHQLRGRVQRSSHQAYCYAFTETQNIKSTERLGALVNAKNGFELAELDLKQRGAGKLSGENQWGISDVAMEALQNLKMVEAARNEARTIIDKDHQLYQYPLIMEAIQRQGKMNHFE